MSLTLFPTITNTEISRLIDLYDNRKSEFADLAINFYDSTFEITESSFTEMGNCEEVGDQTGENHNVMRVSQIY